MLADDKFRTMPSEELCDWVQALILRAEEEDKRGCPHLSAAYRMLPHLMGRVRQLERRNMKREQLDLLNRADALARQGKAGESLRLRCEAEAVGREF